MRLQNEFSFFCDEDKSDITDKALINYLNESINNVKFYRDWARSRGVSSIISAEQLFDFPIISKDHLHEDLDWFLDPRFDKKRYLVTTGGTTGMQTRLFLSNDCYGKEWAFVNFYLASQGVNVNSRRICLRGVSGVREESLIGYNPLYKELLLSPFKLNPASLLGNWSEILNFKPEWIHGYPSSVCEFARLVLDLGLDVSFIKHILLVSEALLPDQHEIIRQAFSSKIMSFYGMTERVIFAPMLNGEFIPNPLYGHTEVVDHELIGTGFNNSATRLIRYKTGDFTDDYKNHSSVVRFNKISGRWGSEFLRSLTGSKITMTALNVHTDALRDVIKYQFYQNEIGKCFLRLQVSNGFDFDSGVNSIVNAFQEKVGPDLCIIPEIVSDIPLTDRGKHKFIVSDLP